METATKSVQINKVKLSDTPTLKTGNVKFDNWFSKKGGMVLRSSIYVSGTSGAGKTTLMINIMNLLSNIVTCLYEREVETQDVCEQTSNVKLHDNAYACDAKSHPHFNDFIKELDLLKPKVVIVDSIQAIAMEDFTEMSEEDACNHISLVLRTWVRDNNAVLFIIGHNTKDGEFAGRNTIMQFMDAHIDMVYDKKTNTRTMSWGKKNRKGSMGLLNYIFGETGIEFYDEEEWNSMTQPMDFQQNFITFVSNYIKKLNPHNETHAKFLADYNEEVKQIRKMEDSLMCNAAFKLLMRLSAKYEM